MKTRTLFILSFLLFLHSTLFAQTILKGVIKDESQSPLTGAVIACLSNADNQLMRGATTDADGKFSIEVNADKEWIRISFLGYADLDYKNPSEMPNEIIMRPADIQLGEVVVQGKSIVTQKEDRLIFSIANSNIVKGNSTTQLLRFTPLIRVEGNRIEMLGKAGVQLYINGKKSNLSGEALQSYLHSLPAEKVEQIELITSPGSEYRVGANEGILNLKLKKNENQGWKGSLSLNDKLGYYNSYNGTLYLDYQKDKLTLSINAYGYKSMEKQEVNTRYEYVNEDLRNFVGQNSYLNHKMGGGNISMNYDLAKNHSLGAMVDVFYSRRHNDIHGITDYGRLSNAATDSTVFSKNQGTADQLITTANMNYRWTTDDKGSQFGVDIDFLHTDNNGDSPMDYSYMKEGTVLKPHVRFTQNTDEKYDNYSGRMEYQHVFTPRTKLKVGVEGYHLKASRNFFYGNYENGSYASDDQKSNYFDMKENYFAAFASLNQVWSPKFISILGFRGEYMDRKGMQHTNGQKVSRSSFAPLPTVTLIYNPSNDHRLMYMLASSKRYLSFDRLNPFRYYISATVYEENDPNLKESQTWIQSLRYIFKQHYTLNLTYMNGSIGDRFSTPVEGGYTQIGYKRFGKSHLLVAVLNWNDSFWDNRLYLNASVDGVFNRSYGHYDDTKVDISNFSYHASLDWGIELSKRYSWNLQGNFKYNSKVTLPQESVKANYFGGIGLRKTFKNGISLNIDGDFLLYNNSERYLETPGYRFYQDSEYHFRKLSVGVTIPFGRQKVSGARTSSSSSSVKSRVKTE